jgi:hypothetical protein
VSTTGNDDSDERDERENEWGRSKYVVRVAVELDYEDTPAGRNEHAEDQVKYSIPSPRSRRPGEGAPGPIDDWSQDEAIEEEGAEQSEIVEAKPASEFLAQLLTDVFGSLELDKVREAAEVLTSELRATGESGKLSMERTERIASYLQEKFMGGTGTTDLDKPTKPRPIGPSTVEQTVKS